MGRVDVSEPSFEFDHDLDRRVVSWNVLDRGVHRICKTIGTARNKAAKVAAALPAWEAHLAEAKREKSREAEAKKVKAAERRPRVSRAEQQAIIDAFSLGFAGRTARSVQRLPALALP